MRTGILTNKNSDNKMALNTELLITLQQVKGIGNKTILKLAKQVSAIDIEELCDMWPTLADKRLQKVSKEDLYAANRNAYKIIEASENAEDLYMRHLLETVDFRLEGKKIALDCANGASYRIARKVYEALGAEVTVMGDKPDGININDGCGSTHPEKLAELVKRTGADIGMAFDGDADRLIVVDEKGRVLDGDRVIAICARMLKEQGRLKENRVTVTVMSNIGFHKAMEESGIEVDVTGVGDRYVLESMLETGCVIGGEQSGHIIFKEHTTTGDGILSSLQFMGAVTCSGRKPSEMADEIEIFPQVLVNAGINNDYKKTYMKDPEIADEIRRIEEKMAGNGRVLIRPSGTEPLVRVMIEGDDEKQLEELAQGLAHMIEEKFR